MFLILIKYSKKIFYQNFVGKKHWKTNPMNEKFIDVSFCWLWEIKKRNGKLNSGIGVSARTARTSINVEDKVKFQESEN